MQVNSGSDFVILNVTNSMNNHVAFETKFAKSLTVADLKKKLEVITGGNAGSMTLQLYKGEHIVKVLDDDSAILGSLQVDNGMRLHVVDNMAWNPDETVEKFELSQDQYDQKQGTVRNFLKNNRLGKYNEEQLRAKEEKQRLLREEEERRAELCTIGSRCEVSIVGNPKRRGAVRYKGPLEGKKGILIGVQYDEPVGKNNGSFDGKEYFVCPQNYGSFVSPTVVEVGDFPPEEDGLDDEI